MSSFFKRSLVERSALAVASLDKMIDDLGDINLELQAEQVRLEEEIKARQAAVNVSSQQELKNDRIITNLKKILE